MWMDALGLVHLSLWLLVPQEWSLICRAADRTKMRNYLSALGVLGSPLTSRHAEARNYTGARTTREVVYIVHPNGDITV